MIFVLKGLSEVEPPKIKDVIPAKAGIYGFHKLWIPARRRGLDPRFREGDIVLYSFEICLASPDLAKRDNLVLVICNFVSRQSFDYQLIN